MAQQVGAHIALEEDQSVVPSINGILLTTTSLLAPRGTKMNVSPLSSPPHYAPIHIYA